MGRHSSISVETEVYVDDVLDELSDKELLEIIEERGMAIPSSLRVSDRLTEIRDMLMRGSVQPAITELDAVLRNLLYPSRPFDPSSNYEAAKRGAHPFLVVTK